MNHDRILVALCAAFVSIPLAEFIANFTRLVVVLLYLGGAIAIVLALYWWWVQACRNYLDSQSKLRREK